MLSQKRKYVFNFSLNRCFPLLDLWRARRRLNIKLARAFFSRLNGVEPSGVLFTLSVQTLNARLPGLFSLVWTICCARIIQLKEKGKTKLLFCFRHLGSNMCVNICWGSFEVLFWGKLVHRHVCVLVDAPRVDTELRAKRARKGEVTASCSLMARPRAWRAGRGIPCVLHFTCVCVCVFPTFLYKVQVTPHKTCARATCVYTSLCCGENSGGGGCLKLSLSNFGVFVDNK